MTRSLQDNLRRYEALRWALGAAIALLVIGFAILVYGPRRAEAEAHQQWIEPVRQQLAEDRQRLAELPAAALEVQRLRTRLERFDRQLEQRDNLAGSIRQITQLARQSSLRNVVVQPVVPRRLEMFSELPLVLAFEGNFMDVFEFLRQAEEMNRLMRIRGIQMSVIDGKLGHVEVKMAMNLYFTEGR